MYRLLFLIFFAVAMSRHLSACERVLQTLNRPSDVLTLEEVKDFVLHFREVLKTIVQKQYALKLSAFLRKVDALAAGNETPMGTLYAQICEQIPDQCLDFHQQKPVFESLRAAFAESPTPWDAMSRSVESL